MRRIALVLTLSLLAATAALGADGNAVAKDATEFAKRVALAAQAAKEKTGQYPASVRVVSRGKDIEIKVQVTPLAEGFSVKAVPAVDARDACPLQNASIDVNLGTGAASAAIVSLVGTAEDGSDVVAFATTGTELAVTVTQGDQTTTINTTTSLADVPAQVPAATTAAVKPPPAATAPATPAPTPAVPAPTPAAPAPATTATTTPAPAVAPAAPNVPAAPTAPETPSAPAAVASTPQAAPAVVARRDKRKDDVLSAVIELAEQPIQLSDGATPIQRPSPAIPP